MRYDKGIKTLRKHVLVIRYPMISRDASVLMHKSELIVAKSTVKMTYVLMIVMCVKCAYIMLLMAASMVKYFLPHNPQHLNLRLSLPLTHLTFLSAQHIL